MRQKRPGWEGAHWTLTTSDDPRERLVAEPARPALPNNTSARQKPRRKLPSAQFSRLHEMPTKKGIRSFMVTCSRKAQELINPCRFNSKTGVEGFNTSWDNDN